MKPEVVRAEQRPVLEHDITAALGRKRQAEAIGDIEGVIISESDMNTALSEYKDLLRSLGGTAL